MTPPARLVPAALLAVVASTALAVVAPTAPALADPGCLSEAARQFQTRCDDDTVPETTLAGSTPRPNSLGYLKEGSISFAFTGAHPDADPDPVGFECRLGTGETPSGSWQRCTSPKAYTGLADSEGEPYTFQVRAVDVADSGINATIGIPVLGPYAADSDVPDEDATPETVSFSVDSTVPNTFMIDDVPFDARTPEFPMLPWGSLMVDLSSNEPDALVACLISGSRLPCQTGQRTLRGLPPGNHVLEAYAVDLAGNVDPTPARVPFSVPRNLVPRKAKGWKRSSAGGSFAGDLVRSTTQGAVLTVRADRAIDFRVLAPTGPRLGKVEMRIGAKGTWVPLKQTGPARSTRVVHQQFFDRKFTGPISFRVASTRHDRPALLDAVLLH